MLGIHGLKVSRKLDNLLVDGMRSDFAGAHPVMDWVHPCEIGTHPDKEGVDACEVGTHPGKERVHSRQLGLTMKKLPCHYWKIPSKSCFQ